MVWATVAIDLEVARALQNLNLVTGTSLQAPQGLSAVDPLLHLLQIFEEPMAVIASQKIPLPEH